MPGGSMKAMPVRMLASALVLAAGAIGLRADPWWVTWTGDAYPETQGWTRYSSNPAAHRWLEDGKLFIDSRAAPFISESYGQSRRGQMTLAPGETFRFSWAVKVTEVLPLRAVDPGIWVSSDDQWDVLLNLGIDTIDSFYEPGKHASFTPGVFHVFELHSSDLRTYRLSIDGTPAFEGVFFKSLFYMPGVGWGDVTTGRSLAEWDWVHAGIVPEPSAWLLAGPLALVRRMST